MSNSQTSDFSAALLTWYDKNKRALPWRDRQDDGYAVWISEIMLQQTTVNAVVGFYERWMERFPTVEELARAELDEVLKYWAGLGYYARARNIHASAKEIVAHFAGKLPTSTTELMSLPGIGRYTAGAISSIAYNVDSPIVDANVTRVFCRLLALEGDPKTSLSVQKATWEHAERTIPPGKARDYNQGLMELGALVCLPSSPRCECCPVSSFCQGFKSGTPTRFPEFLNSKKWIKQTHAACMVVFDSKVLLVQRPLNELWGGLWELPRVQVKDDEHSAVAATRAAYEAVGITVSVGHPIGMVKHVVTNRRIVLIGYSAEWDGQGQLESLGCRRYTWLSPDEIDGYAVSSPQVELIKQWRAGSQQVALDF